MAIGVKTNPSVLGAVDYPQYSGSPVNFIPQVYAGKMLVKFYKNTLFGEIANTDYQGEISSLGDKVIIRTTPDVTVSDYTKGLTLAVQAPTANSTELVIDKAKYFNVAVDDIDAFQSDVNMVNQFTDDAGHQMKIVIDADILAVANLGTQAGIKGDIFEAADASLHGVTTDPLPLVSSSSPGAGKQNILDFIVDCMVKMDEWDVPEEGRYVVLPPWAIGRIKKSELKDASLAGDGTSILRNGRVGMIDRATIYYSNNLPAGVAGSLAAGEYGAYFGQRHGLSFASQITKTETLKSQTTFGNLIRGLNVYGYKVLKDKAVGFAVISKG